MQPEITHYSVFTVEFDLALPVDGFVGIEVARVEETAIDLDDAAKSIVLDHVADALYRGIERELR